MSTLITGLVVFFAIHLLPTWPALRNRLQQRLGERGYQALFALIALVGLVLIAGGMARAPFEPLYTPPTWGRMFAALVLLPAFMLLAAAYLPGNVRRYTRHPMLWAVALWATAHLAANGDRASVLLFGSFLAYALVDMLSATLRGAQKQTARWPLVRDAYAAILGLVVYAGVMRAHPWLFGVEVFA